MQVESSATPLLPVDEVEQVHRQRAVSLIGHVFQLTYAAILNARIQEEKVTRCHGCAIQHPSQRQHSCLMMDSEDAWFYFQNDAVEKMKPNDVLKIAAQVPWRHVQCTEDCL